MMHLIKPQLPHEITINNITYSVQQTTKGNPYYTALCTIAGKKSDGKPQVQAINTSHITGTNYQTPFSCYLNNQLVHEGLRFILLETGNPVLGFRAHTTNTMNQCKGTLCEHLVGTLSQEAIEPTGFILSGLNGAGPKYYSFIKENGNQ